MKLIAAKIFENIHAEVFAVRVIELPYFSTEFHFHKECQLVYVVESEGKRIIGDSVENFQGDELVLLGSDIPHVWYNDKHYFEKDKTKIHARSIVLFFNPEKLIEAISPFASVKKLELVFNTARRGMKFSGSAKESFKNLLFEMTTKQGLGRLIGLLKILDLLTQTLEYELLASAGYINAYNAKDNERIEKVFKYVFSNFTKEIDLDDAADLANMNKQAFCRYFKSRTKKTFIQFVNDVRIGHACKLMTDGNAQIAGLAYDCGFNSLSNFNRLFKEAKGMTPREYKKILAE